MFAALTPCQPKNGERGNSRGGNVCGGNYLLVFVVVVRQSATNCAKGVHVHQARKGVEEMSRLSNGVGKYSFADVARLRMALNQNKESMLKRSAMREREFPSEYLTMSPVVGVHQQQPRFFAEEDRTICATQGISARHCMRTVEN